ncbi:MAG: hypothetical protein HN413_15440 [Chloroflexi bacterium]|jgi:hypothetical protein|nr:hypothetical protein [Chloroflexota bacterium]
MKKSILILTLLTTMLILSACGGSASEAESAATQLTSTGEDDLSVEVQLALGTVKLDEGENAIDAAQAAELLPLWKALRSFSGSEITAPEEVDAVVSQIETTMTNAQIKAIAAMQLSREDFASVYEALGIEIAFGGDDITPEMQATMQAARESGEGPPEGFGGGQGMGGGSGGGGGETALDPAARETAIAERGGTRGAGVGVNTALLDAIIEFLESKTQ